MALVACGVFLCPTTAFAEDRLPADAVNTASSAVSTSSAVTSLLTKTGQQRRKGTWAELERWRGGADDLQFTAVEIDGSPA
jgi:hypothetical protein